MNAKGNLYAEWQTLVSALLTLQGGFSLGACNSQNPPVRFARLRIQVSKRPITNPPPSGPTGPGYPMMMWAVVFRGRDHDHSENGAWPRRSNNHSEDPRFENS